MHWTVTPATAKTAWLVDGASHRLLTMWRLARASDF